MEQNRDNRYSFSTVHEDFFRRCAAAMAGNAGQWCCLAVDIEHFKLFNEVYGQEQGNLLLQNFADILAEAVPGGVSAHFGQDDFALFMPYDREVIEALYDRLHAAVTAMGKTTGFLPAIGVYRLSTEEPVSLSTYDKAYIAASDAKQNRENRILEFDSGLYSQKKSDFQVLSELSKAVNNGQITFFLQPQCRISTRQVIGCEALARWVNPDGSIVSPGVFIPLLEKYGFIADFDKMIWDKVGAWLRKLLNQGLQPVPVSVNISQTDMTTMDVVEVLTGICRKYDLPTSLLKAEITESSYAEHFDRVHPLVQSLREKGFITMMDDFGSGYSSLNMLENISVDVLKLDMNFVRERNLHTRRGITIVESIINMAKMMDLPIVVEGIETESQVSFLRSLGVRYAQGFYFFRPMPAADFEPLLSQPQSLDYQGFRCKRNEQFHVREFLDENTFTDAMLNNILGAVAFYALDGKDLTITRFNEQFYHAIGDASMESRQAAIQNYVVKEDWPYLYRALDEAAANVSVGGTCEIRFYKSDNSVFWFHIHFFYLRNEQDKKIFYGQIRDVTEARQQSLQFFEVLREQSEVAMLLNLDQETIRYAVGPTSLHQIGLPSMDLETSISRTIDVRIDDPEDKRKFREFFDIDRLRAAHKKAIYHENITIDFRLAGQPEPVEFSTYIIRHSKEQDLVVYAFAKRPH